MSFVRLSSFSKGGQPSSWLRRALIVSAALGLVLSQTQQAHAATQSSPPKEAPILLQADHLDYDQDTGIITATGHVEVSRDEQILLADKIIYDKPKDIVTAYGNVAMRQPSGDVIFSTFAELTGDMREAFINRASILFRDNSRLAAQDGERFEGRYLIVHKGVYSSCNLCADDPTKPPLWQMKGARVTHDSETKDVIYRDATLEFDGVPLFYTPYFSHPDPSVERRQGFLMPNPGYNRNIGTFVRTPYYFDIAPNDDLVLTPTFSTIDNIQMAGDWRHRFTNGTMEWNASATSADYVNEAGIDKGDQFRGHVFGKSLFNLDNVWRAGTDVALTTDKSYLPRYSISSEDVLLNRGYLEGFSGRNYYVSNVYYFQDLRPGAQMAEPLVAPDMRMSMLGEPGQTLGGRWSFDAGLLTTTRNEDVAQDLQGPNTRRLSVATGWQRQMVSSTGFLTTFSGLARADGYWADNVPDSNLPSGSEQVTKTRPFAQGDITVRYPMGRRGDGYQQIVEPIAVFSSAPDMSRYDNLPNEDSLSVDFDETNLFSPNRFSGIDRLEGGTRTAYGLRHAVNGDNGARVEMLGGQVFRLNKDNTFPDGSGLTERFSDYVGRIDITPNKWADLNYGFRLDQQTADFKRQEIQLSAGPREFRPFGNYLMVKQVELSDQSIVDRVQEVTFGFSSTFLKYYTLAASHRQAFEPAPGPRSTGISLTYQDECFQFGLTGSRDDTNRLDLRSGTSIVFHFYLKNIGGVHTDSVTSGSFTPGLGHSQDPGPIKDSSTPD